MRKALAYTKKERKRQGINWRKTDILTQGMAVGRVLFLCFVPLWEKGREFGLYAGKILVFFPCFFAAGMIKYFLLGAIAKW